MYYNLNLTNIPKIQRQDLEMDVDLKLAITYVHTAIIFTLEKRPENSPQSLEAF